MNETITAIEQAMLPHLNNQQMERLHIVLQNALMATKTTDPEGEKDYLSFYISAKHVEGCSVIIKPPLLMPFLQSENL